MIAKLTADIVVIVHLAFIVFVVTGGFLVIRWRWVAFLHIPCAVWGALIEFTGWICPLTPLECWLREAAGGAGYGGGFVDHYVVPLVYPGLSQNCIRRAVGLPGDADPAYAVLARTHCVGRQSARLRARYRGASAGSGVRLRTGFEAGSGVEQRVSERQGSRCQTN